MKFTHVIRGWAFCQIRTESCRLMSELKHQTKSMKLRSMRAIHVPTVATLIPALPKIFSNSRSLMGRSQRVSFQFCRSSATTADICGFSTRARSDLKSTLRFRTRAKVSPWQTLAEQQEARPLTSLGSGL